MSALAVFTCRANSHPFQERHVPLHERMKIGRSVARARPAANNAIFDCKVLSRNHALVWYENGKFYLQDTKSSNGTFVNNERLSKGSEESPPRVIFSDDVIQFGVDVMENSRRGEEIVTHSCIIASVQLFHPDGQEATNDHSNSFLNYGPGASVQSQEVYQLAQYLQDALHREQMLENKLATLQRLVQSTQEASQSGWQALIDEDRLLSRLEVLENQLQVYSKNQTEDTLRQELTALQEDKFNYETTAKESLRKVLEEKIDAVRKLSDLERSLSNTEDECQHLRNMCESSQKELQELAERHQEQTQELAKLNQKLEEEEQNHTEETERFGKERAELDEKLQEMVTQEQGLQVKVEKLQADNDFTKEQLTNMRSKMENVRGTNKENESLLIPELISTATQVDMVNLLDLQNLHQNLQDSSEDESEKADNDVEMRDASAKEAADVLAELDFELDKEDMDEDEDSDEIIPKNLKDSANESDLAQYPLDDSANTSAQQLHSPEKLQETQETIAHYKKLLAESESRLKQNKGKLEDLQSDVSSAQSECSMHLNTIASLEARMCQSDEHINQMVEAAVQDMKSQLAESRAQTEKSEILASTLKEEISGLEVELERYRAELNNDRGSRDNPEGGENHPDYSDITLKPKKGDRKQLSNNNDQLSQEVITLKEKVGDMELAVEQRQCDVTLLKELLKEARESLKNKEKEVGHLRVELDDAIAHLKRSTEESDQLVTQIAEANKMVSEKAGHVDKLKEQLSKAEVSTKEVKHQILALRDGLLEEQEHVRLMNEEGDKLKQDLESSQDETKQAREEAVRLKTKCDELQSRAAAEAAIQLLTTPSPKHSPTTRLSPSTQPRSVGKVQPTTSTTSPRLRTVGLVGKDAVASQDDLEALKEECGHLRLRIQDIENEMKTYRQENKNLKKDKARLQAAYEEVDAIKNSLEQKQSVSELNLTDTQKNADHTKDELNHSNEEVARLQDKCSKYKEDLSRLRTDFADMGEEYSTLAFKSKTTSVISMIPLLMLLFGLIVAFYPVLSQITATAQPGGPL